MATQNPFSKMYDVEVVGGDQRQRLAEMLRANALNTPQGQMVSGWYVPPSWTQNLAHLAQTATGVFGGAALDQERKETAARLLREMTQGVPTEENKLAHIPGIMPQQGEGQSTPTPLEQTPANQSMAKMPQYRPLTDEEKLGKAMELARVDPYAAQIWSAQDTAKQARAMKLEDLAEKRAYEEKRDERERMWRREDKQFAASLAAGTRGGEKWTYDAGSDTWVMPPNAQFPMGRTTPNISKVGALKNLNYLADAFTVGGVDEKGNPVKPILDTTPQGGWLGITGMAGTVTDYASAKAFDNKVEQLSNELRKIHRIPGEGTLSDKEQAQYGIQLPKKTNPRELNEQIIQDMRVRGTNAVLPSGVNPLQMNPSVPQRPANYGTPPAGAVREKK